MPFFGNFALLLLFPGAPAAAGSGVQWQTSLSPQFEVSHESRLLPPGLLMQLGKLHNRLRLDLAQFAPWMAKERVRVYLYRNRDNYVRGEFEPPAWSNGVAFSDRRLMATHEMPEKEKLFTVLAHELTHLFFESYWAEEGKTPPVWLNEGLSMLEESDPRRAEESDWHRAMHMLATTRGIPFTRFFAIRPTKDLADEDKDTVTLWYVQAYSVVYFLYREHTQLQFRNLCRLLRDGKPLEDALWTVYRYKTSADLERAWRAWLKLPAAQARGSARKPASASPAPGGEPEAGRAGLRAVDFRDFHFHSLAPGEKK